MTTHSSILAWRIQWTEELGRLQSMGRKESDMTERLSLSALFFSLHLTPSMSLIYLLPPSWLDCEFHVTWGCVPLFSAVSLSSQTDLAFRRSPINIW